MVIAIILLSIAVVILLARCYLYDLMCEVLTEIIREHRGILTKKEIDDFSNELKQRFRKHLERRFKRR